MAQMISVRKDKRLIALGFYLLMLSGCTTVTVAEGETKALTAIGIVRLKLPATPNGSLIVERSGIGLGWDKLPSGGAWLGLSKAQWVIADPATCQLIMIVKNRQQLESSKAILAEMKGDGICIVKAWEQ